MSDIINEINTVMNYYALVDSCQSTNNQSIKFSISAMSKFHELIKDELQYKETRELFTTLEKIFLPRHINK